MSPNQQDINRCSIIIATNKGHNNYYHIGRVISYDLKSMILYLDCKIYSHVTKRMNYNAFRVSRENYNSAQIKIINKIFDMRKYVLDRC